ncbi:MAG: AhpC/TSA family protein [Bacteroidales bacterium]|nr:AhpC/TSA family protein [Bacteroidales bacterium]
MKSFKLIAAAALVIFLSACGHNTVIEGNLRDGAGKEVIVKLLDVNRFQVLDTLKVGKDGSFRYSLDVAEGEPEFVYLFYGDRRIASLLLKNGDKVKVLTDTLGVYSVEGSEESVKLQQVERDYGKFQQEMERILDDELSPDPSLSRCYVNYYRDRLKYVVGNCHSLTVVPVLFQQVNPSFPVFSRSTDGIVMKSICDSLKTLYPQSRYVKALEKEAARRMDEMSLENKLRAAEEVGYMDIELPSMNGKNVKLSESLGKVTLLYFWASTVEQKMFNLDTLLPLYEEFHQNGFEIYAVSFDSDKTAWARAVCNQNLPWVNVCDTRGALSPYIDTYGIGALPMMWMLDGDVIDPGFKAGSRDDIRHYLRGKF